MTIRSLTLFFLIFLSSCNKLWENDAANYKVTGVVVDQVTKSPVGGASIYLGSTFCDVGDNISPLGPIATSDANGNFKLVYSESILEKYGCSYIYASKSGYMGSNIFHSIKGGVLDGNIELYHPSKLILTVKNDTINDQIDEAKICFYCEYRFDGYPGIFGSRGFAGSATVVEICRGRKFDSTFVFDKLWGNLVYALSVMENKSTMPQVRSSYNITTKPDSTVHCVVTF